VKPRFKFAVTLSGPELNGNISATGVYMVHWQLWPTVGHWALALVMTKAVVGPFKG
jgi:hypothetical protein